MRPVPDVVMAGDMHEGTANRIRRRCLEQIELAVAERDLVVVAEVLVGPECSRILGGIAIQRIEKVLPVDDGCAARRDERQV